MSPLTNNNTGDDCRITNKLSTNPHGQLSWIY
jgi:hypothetical protein